MLNTELRNQPVELCGILASTDLLILEILDRLEFPAVRSASIHTYLVCVDKDMEFILNDFEALVELAKDTPTFFTKKLHCYLGKMVESLRSEKGGVAALLQLASKLQEMRRSEKTDAVRAEVAGIYADLVLHALDYTRLPPEDLGEVEENAYDLGYQAALRHKGITWGEAAELQQYRSLGSLENLQQLVKERRRKSGAQED